MFRFQVSNNLLAFTVAQEYHYLLGWSSYEEREDPEQISNDRGSPEESR